ncbi:UNVERIFIED_CONTAM: hypothetical protein Slati_0487600 [Sesamum latifolium]|uniref:Uncharacterized protein n=1 Tax=Sesamum latifolium TaxID=2727402 RepID=A0AAW2XX64_9LAMI
MAGSLRQEGPNPPMIEPAPSPPLKERTSLPCSPQPPPHQMVHPTNDEQPPSPASGSTTGHL